MNGACNNNIQSIKNQLFYNGCRPKDVFSYKNNNYSGSIVNIGEMNDEKIELMEGDEEIHDVFINVVDNYDKNNSVVINNSPQKHFDIAPNIFSWKNNFSNSINRFFDKTNRIIILTLY